MGPDAMTLACWMLNFKPAFSVFSFTFTKRLSSSSFPSVIKVVSSAYLRLLLLLPAILILACASSSLAFRMMYCAFGILTSNERELLLLHVFASSWCCQCFELCYSDGVWWYLIAILICSFLRCMVLSSFSVVYLSPVYFFYWGFCLEPLPIF